MKQLKRRLHLSKITVRKLEDRELASIGGNGWIGQLYYFLSGTCWCGGDDGDANGSSGVRG